MAIFKNAKRVYEIAAVGEPTQFKKLGKFISKIENETEDISEESSYYDGDGTPQETITGIKEQYKVEGLRDTDDEAQNLIVGLLRKTGEERIIILKVTKEGNVIEKGKAVVKNIIDGGGEAKDNAPFGCTIARIETPTNGA